MANIMTRLKEILAGKKQVDIGKAIGMAGSAVGKTMNLEDNIPSKRFVNGVCKAYGINRRWVITGEGEKYIHSQGVSFARRAITQEEKWEIGSLMNDIKQANVKALFAFNKLNAAMNKVDIVLPAVVGSGQQEKLEL